MGDLLLSLSLSIPASETWKAPVLYLYLVSFGVLDLAVQVDVPPHGHRHVEHLTDEGRLRGGLAHGRHLG